MQGSTVMRQRSAETLAPEEPYALIAHVRVCGGAGWVTTGSTRKLTAHSAGFLGYSRCSLLWAAAQRERSVSCNLLRYRLHCIHDYGIQTQGS